MINYFLSNIHLSLSHTHSHSLSLSLSLSFFVSLQYSCYNDACSYDGGDNCPLNPNSTDPWAACSLKQTCRRVYKDGNCDVSCNTKDCLYDGGDCSPECPIKDRCHALIGDNQCTEECNTQQCAYDFEDCGGTPNYVSLTI